MARGLRLTPQRDVLLRALSETMGHPTADDLVKKVRMALPTVSHATVYRNVQELVRAGLIGTLERCGAAVQCEINPDHHHRFTCRRCGQVWDVYLAQIAVMLDRYRNTRTIQVAAGKVSTINIEFPKGTIALNAVPWADVWIDGEKVGETPVGNLPVTIGAHEIIFRHPDFGEQRHVMTVTLAAPARLSVDMRKKP